MLDLILLLLVAHRVALLYKIPPNILLIAHKHLAEPGQLVYHLLRTDDSLPLIILKEYIFLTMRKKQINSLFFTTRHQTIYTYIYIYVAQFN